VGTRGVEGGHLYPEVVGLRLKGAALTVKQPDPSPRPSPLCAVLGCVSPGRAHTCPADGTSHGHGRVHYEHCHSALVFREGWHLVCDEHYRVLADSRRAWEAMRRSGEVRS